MSDVVLRYTDCAGTRHRVRVKPVPGSAHHTVIRERKQNVGDEWRRVRAIEARCVKEAVDYE